jgi:outer membrane murein-binding lipoprotein Lpp
MGAYFNLVVGCKHFLEKRGSKMSIELSILISGVAAAFAIFFGLKNSRRNDVKDIEERATRDATIMVKLDAISSDVKAIKGDISNINKKVDAIDRRVTIVEQSAKSAHKRLDGIMNKEGRDGD